MRNKAAEKAKHAHQQQQAQQQQGQQQGQPGSGGSVSVIAHAPATAAGHPAATAPNAYSISGILGIPAHHQDPNGNSIKRKRTDDGESLNSSPRLMNYRPVAPCEFSSIEFEIQEIHHDSREILKIGNTFSFSRVESKIV